MKSSKIINHSYSSKHVQQGSRLINFMQIRTPHNLTGYLIMALVLSAIFLAVRYSLEFKPIIGTGSEAAVTHTQPMASNLAPDNYEQRFRQLELWLGQTQDAYETRFEKLEQKLIQSTFQPGQSTDPSTAPYYAKLKQLEQWLGQTQDAYEARFEKLEQQLPQAATPNDNRLQEIEERLAQTTSRLNELSTSLTALTDDTSTVAGTEKFLRLTPPDGLPGQPPASHGDEPAQTGQAKQPSQIASATRTDRGRGKWVINLASYVNEQTAATHMASFQNKGINAEMVSASVHGKTIYRVRIPGFDSMAAARAMVPAVKRQLGLKDTWIIAD